MKLMECFYVDSDCDRVTGKHPRESSTSVCDKAVSDKRQKEVKNREDSKYIQILTDTSAEMLDIYNRSADFDRLYVISRDDYNGTNDRQRRVSSKHERKDCVRATNNEKSKDRQSYSSEKTSKSSRTSGIDPKDDNNESFATGLDVLFSSQEFETLKSKKNREVNMKINDCCSISVSDHNPRRRMGLSKANSSRRMVVGKESCDTTSDSDSNHSDSPIVSVSDNTPRRQMNLARANSSRRLVVSKERGDDASDSDSSHSDLQNSFDYGFGIYFSKENEKEEKTGNKSDSRRITVSDHHPRRQMSLTRANSSRRMVVNKEPCDTSSDSDSNHSDSPNTQDLENSLCDRNENEKRFGEKPRRQRVSRSKSGNSFQTMVDSKESCDCTKNTRLQRSDSQLSLESDSTNGKHRSIRTRRSQSIKLDSSLPGEHQEGYDLKLISLDAGDDSCRLHQSMTMVFFTDDADTEGNDLGATKEQNNVPIEQVRVRRRQSLSAAEIKQYIDKNDKSGGRSLSRTASGSSRFFMSSNSITMPLTDRIDTSLQKLQTEMASSDRRRVAAAFAA